MKTSIEVWLRTANGWGKPGTDCCTVESYWVVERLDFRPSVLDPKSILKEANTIEYT